MKKLILVLLAMCALTVSPSARVAPTVKYLYSGTDSTQGIEAFTASAGTPSSSTDFAVTGPRSVKHNGNNVGAIYTNIGLADTGTAVSFRWRCHVAPTGQTFVLFRDSANTNVLTISGSDPDHFISLGAGVTDTSSMPFVIDTWYRFTLSYTITSSTVWTAKLYVDGVLLLTSTVSGTLGSTGIDRMLIRSATGMQPCYFDDLYVDDRSDGSDPGNVHVTSKRAFASGTTTDFSSQVGSGNSGYGSGHADEVNEQPLSVTNGWSMVGAGGAVTEEYSIEGPTVGDVNLSCTNVLDTMGWIYAKSLASETGQIIARGGTSNISLTSTNTYFTRMSGSRSYPGGGNDVGIVTSTDLTTVSLFEAGMEVGYLANCPGAAINLMHRGGGLVQRPHAR